jgi:cell wall-associated NlpC family hydrolase
MMSEFLTGSASASTAKPVAVKSEAPAGQKLSGFAKVANTDGDQLRMRSKAGTMGGVITMLSPGASVAVKAGPVVDSEKISWYQISANGVTGWVMGQYLVQSKAPAVPVAEAKPAAVQEAPKAAPAPAVAAPAAPAQPIQAASTEATRTGTSRGAEPPAAPVGSRNNTIVDNAMQYVGYRYRYGGSSPNGFDCSGFVYYIVNKSGGKVGRTIPYQINSGTRISRADLQPGDLLFFSNTYKRGLSHAGIYIGNGKFIHAQNERSGVLVSSLNTAYWSSHYTGATRTR